MGRLSVAVVVVVDVVRVLRIVVARASPATALRIGSMSGIVDHCAVAAPLMGIGIGSRSSSFKFLNGCVGLTIRFPTDERLWPLPMMPTQSNGGLPKTTPPSRVTSPFRRIPASLPMPSCRRFPGRRQLRSWCHRRRRLIMVRCCPSRRRHCRAEPGVTEPAVPVVVSDGSSAGASELSPHPIASAETRANLLMRAMRPPCPLGCHKSQFSIVPIRAFRCAYCGSAVGWRAAASNAPGGFPSAVRSCRRAPRSRPGASSGHARATFSEHLGRRILRSCGARRAGRRAERDFDRCRAIVGGVDDARGELGASVLRWRSPLGRSCSSPIVSTSRFR